VSTSYHEWLTKIPLNDLPDELIPTGEAAGGRSKSEHVTPKRLGGLMSLDAKFKTLEAKEGRTKKGEGNADKDGKEADDDLADAPSDIESEDDGDYGADYYDSDAASGGGDDEAFF
jgi:hypothetical protein